MTSLTLICVICLCGISCSLDKSETTEMSTTSSSILTVTDSISSNGEMTEGSSGDEMPVCSPNELSVCEVPTDCQNNNLYIECGCDGIYDSMGCVRTPCGSDSECKPGETCRDIVVGLNPECVLSDEGYCLCFFDPISDFSSFCVSSDEC